ncbi:hypothetical protein CYMTET_14870 [Cymbomonas tetramitiformis]|uniref:Uncharacterized protein n=1 Tax=Cymbomonas tetramitiformis TaxID=36881 RepID=A0AAE0GF61_9CHLO|nr:hypothetical protein CYMTET_14870 [Cymbomonas tetramitiformis]
MINLRASGNYKAPNAKHMGADNRLRQNRQGSDPTFMVDQSYARLTIASADEEVQASLDKFFTQASAKVEDRTDDLPDRRWETLVFVFDEAHMFATSAKKMKHLTDMITKLVKMENRMNAIFVMLSGTLFTETSLCKSWKEYRTVVDALPNSKHEFAVSYLNELPVTLRPTYTFKYLGPSSLSWAAFLSFGATVQAPGGVDQITATHTKTDPVDRMKACLQNLKWVIKKIRSEYDMKKKYLLFMPQIKIEVDGKMQSFDPLGEGIFINQTRYDLRANMLSQLSEEETSDNIELAILPNEDGGELSMMHDSDRRMLGSIDSKSEIARKRMCCGIAKAGVPSYNDTLIQMFGRVKDAESDVNIDYPSHDITQLQLLITSSCTTGADFMGVSEVYFVGTPASSTEFQQNMYRAIRMCSHALPHLKEGVRVYGVGFSESHEVCQEAKVDDSLREIMGRCIDSEIDKKSDKIVSRYTLETDTPTTFGKSLRSYERFNKVHDKKIIALQERRILQIRGDAIKYAPQFVMDSEEDVEHFTKYTIIPSPSVVSFVKRYEEAADPIARMTCMLEYYYRDSTSFEEMEVEHVTEGQTYNIQPDEALDLNALRDKLTLFHKYLDGKDDELKSIRNDQQLYTITDVLLETQEFLEGMASVEVQGDDWKELHYLDVHRLIDSIRFRVSKLIRGRYAHLIESDGKQHKMAVYGAVMTEGAYMNNETFTERSAVDEKGKAIDKEYASALSESGSMNMYLYMAKKIFRLLTKARSRVLKARNVTQTVPDSWNYSVLFDLQVLEAFCVKHESIADYLLRISIFTPKVGCSDDFRDKVMNYTFNNGDEVVPIMELLQDGNCDIWMNMKVYRDPDNKFEIHADFFKSSFKFELPLDIPQGDALINDIKYAMKRTTDSTLPCRLTVENPTDSPEHWFTDTIAKQKLLRAAAALYLETRLQKEKFANEDAKRVYRIVLFRSDGKCAPCDYEVDCALLGGLQAYLSHKFPFSVGFVDRSEVKTIFEFTKEGDEARAMALERFLRRLPFTRSEVETIFLFTEQGNEARERALQRFLHRPYFNRSDVQTIFEFCKKGAERRTDALDRFLQREFFTRFDVATVFEFSDEGDQRRTKALRRLLQKHHFDRSDVKTVFEFSEERDEVRTQAVERFLELKKMCIPDVETLFSLTEQKNEARAKALQRLLKCDYFNKLDIKTIFELSEEGDETRTRALERFLQREPFGKPDVAIIYEYSKKGDRARKVALRRLLERENFDESDVKAVFEVSEESDDIRTEALDRLKAVQKARSAIS